LLGAKVLALFDGIFHFMASRTCADQIVSRTVRDRYISICVSALVFLGGCSRSGKDQRQVEPDPSTVASASVVVASAAASTSAMAEPSLPVASAVIAPASAPSALPPLRALNANQTVAVLVRTKVTFPAKPVEWTRFIQADGSVVSQKGLHLFIGDNLYRYQQREKATANPPCDSETPNPYPKQIHRNAEFVPDKKGKAIEVIEMYKHDSTQDQVIPTDIEHEIVAVIPGYAFIKTSIIDYGCGAHALYGNKFVLVAFGAEGTFEIVKRWEYEEGSDAQLNKAVEQFNAKVDPAEPADSIDGRLKSGDISISMAYPAFTPRGSVWTVLYTGPATWAGSNGGWAGYTRSVPIPLDIAPARFREAMVMPDGAATYIGAHEKDEDILGFTVGDSNAMKK
jgi:hypothetical protein